MGETRSIDTGSVDHATYNAYKEVPQCYYQRTWQQSDHGRHALIILKKAFFYKYSTFLWMEILRQLQSSGSGFYLNLL